MAQLQTPIIPTILPFDPNYAVKIEFVYNDNQAFKNRAVITNADTNAIVYDETITSMRLAHEIPANTLSPGKYYIQIQVFDEDGNSSLLSDTTLFYCFVTPTVYFNNITDGMVYKNANLDLEFVYEQPDGETIKSYQFFQYGYDKALINSSDIYYSTSSMTHSYYGLNNDTVYYFRVVGETQKGITFDTGYIEVNVKYETMPANVVLDVENNYCNGYISIMVNILDVEFSTDNDDYTLENGSVTLKNNALTYRGFNVDGDFTLYVETKSLPLNKAFLKTDDRNISLYIKELCGNYYAKLELKENDYALFEGIDNNLFSITNGYIEVTNNDSFVFELKRKNGIYGLNIYLKSQL